MQSCGVNCPSCGYANDAANKFCLACGIRLGTPTPSAAPTRGGVLGPGGVPIGAGWRPGAALQPQRRAMSRFQLFLVLALVLGVVVRMGTKAPQTPATASASTTTLLGSPAPFTLPSPSALPTVAGSHSAIRIESAVPCRGVSGDGQPAGGSATSFPTAATLYCLVRGHFPKDGALTAVCQSPAGATLAQRVVAPAEGNFAVPFAFVPTGTWTEGRYTVSLITDGVLARTVSFDVQGALAQAQQDLGVDSVIMCRRVDKDFAPLDPTQTFKSHDSLYCSIHVSGKLGRGQRVTLHWVPYEGTMRDQELVTKNTGARNLYFSKDPATGGWYPGRYRLDVSVNGTLAKSVTFFVER